MAENTFGKINNNGVEFNYSATIFAPTETHPYNNVLLDKTAPKFTLKYDCIDLISYTNDILSPLLTGTIIYTDKYGDMSLYNEMPYVYCVLNLQKIDPDSKSVEVDSCFNHIFIVEKIELIDNSSTIFRYKLSLVSSLYWNFISNITYSNYNKDAPESTADILKNIFGKAKLNIEIPDNISFQNKYWYITSTNDTVLDAYKATLSKTFASPEAFAENRLLFLVYNDILNKYQYVQINNKETYIKQHPSKVDFIESITNPFLGNMNLLTNQENTRFSSRNQYAKTDLIKQLRASKSFDYSLNTNEITKTDILQSNFINFYNSQLNANGVFKNKFFSYDREAPILQKDLALNVLDYHTSLCKWFNDSNYYTSSLALLCKMDNISIDTMGSVSRKPGVLMNVIFDDNESLEIKEQEQIAQYKALKTKLVGLRGIWFAVKVTHNIENNRYRNDIVLARNFKYA